MIIHDGSTAIGDDNSNSKATIMKTDSSNVNKRNVLYNKTGVNSSHKSKYECKE